MSLDTLGILFGTDKSSLRWDYLRHYEELFWEWRDREFNLVEIGVGGGNSVAVWSRFFSQATIVGIDTDEQARRASGERIFIEIGSQADGDFLDYICDKYPPGIIIDDGSHHAEHIMFSFRRLFPRLEPGGLYIIEDLNITFGLEAVPVTPHDFLAGCARALMYRTPGNHAEPTISRNIDRIDFMPGMVFVRKRHPDERRRRLEQAPGIVARTVQPNNFHWLGEVLLNEMTDTRGARAAAERAVELHGAVALYHLGLSIVLEHGGDLAAALGAARAAIMAEPDNYQCHLRLAELLARSGDADGAAMALQHAANAAPSADLRGQVDIHRARILAMPG